MTPDQFFARVDAIVPNEKGCRLWPCKKRAIVWMIDDMQPAARLVLQRTLGRRIKDKWEACHTCDDGRCVEPSHIFEGTHQDNIRDAWNKQHWHIPRPNLKGKKLGPKQGSAIARGERNGKSKLTETKVRDIRKLYGQGDLSMQKIADMIGCSDSVICQVVNRKAWAHVD